MSVKQKFRKSKKSKSESKGKNNKYNNEKRRKIQRKTKKRVLIGGDGEEIKVSSTRSWFARRTRNEKITKEQCIDLQQKIAEIKGQNNIPKLTEHALRDHENCLKSPIKVDVYSSKTSSQDLSSASNTPPAIISDDGEENDDNEAVNEAAEQQRLSADEAEQQRLVNEAEQQRLVNEAEQQRLADEEEERQAILEGNRAAAEEVAALAGVLSETQEDAEARAEAKKQAEIAAQLVADTEVQKLLSDTHPENDGKLDIFPQACFSQHNMCETASTAAFGQTYFLYQFLMSMKKFIIKNYKHIDLSTIINSSTNIPFLYTNVESFLKFFKFYNRHTASQESEKFIPSEPVITDKNDNIVMKQYPNIDLKTFYNNCYYLYSLLLSVYCNIVLGLSAYDIESSKSEINQPVHFNAGDLGDIFRKKPTLFSHTEITKENLGKIITTLSKTEDIYKKRYMGLLGDSPSGSDSEFKTQLDHYNLILPLNFYVPVIPPPSDTRLLEILKFIDEYLKYPTLTIVCAYMITGSDGLSTRAKVRDMVENLLKDSDQELNQLVIDGTIFTRDCNFIAGNPNIKQRIIEIIRINNTQIIKKKDDINILKTDVEGCEVSSGNFLIEVNDPSNDFKTDIFFHMIIYACYMTKNAEKAFFGLSSKPEKWGKQGTDLMILYMNDFVTNFFNHILSDIIPFYKQFNHDNNIGSSVVLIDKNNSYLFTLVEGIKNAILEFDLSGKTNKDLNAQTHTLHLYNQLESIQKFYENINKKALNFIESLSKKDGSNTLLSKMNKFNIAVAVEKLCIKKKGIVINIYQKHFSKSEMDQIIQNIELQRQEQPTLFLTNELKQRFTRPTNNKELLKIKLECRKFVIEMISMAREYHKNRPANPLYFTDAEMINLNRCCELKDVFNKGEGSIEYNKRIGRASYALSELWPYIDDRQKLLILKLPGVKNLLENIKDNSELRKIIEYQCNDDGKGELKKIGRITWRKSMSKRRSAIIKYMGDRNLESTCKEDIENLREMSETPEETADRLDNDIREKEFKNLGQAEINSQPSTPPKIVLTPEQLRNNKLRLARAYVKILNNRENSNVYSINNAERFKDENPGIYTQAITEEAAGAAYPLHTPTTVKSQEFNKRKGIKTTNVSLLGRMVGNPSTTSSSSADSGGTISTKNKTKHSIKHKSNHKANTQSNPKHKNKSKPKTKSKTIKKNKRAHHKFYKKYSRKR